MGPMTVNNNTNRRNRRRNGLMYHDNINTNSARKVMSLDIIAFLQSAMQQAVSDTTEASFTRKVLKARRLRRYTIRSKKNSCSRQKSGSLERTFRPQAVCDSRTYIK